MRVWAALNLGCSTQRNKLWSDRFPQDGGTSAYVSLARLWDFLQAKNI